jgi:hypothetical protein
MSKASLLIASLFLIVTATTFSYRYLKKDIGEIK